MDVIKELISIRKENALTLRELSMALNMTEKSVWSLISNSTTPQRATKEKIEAFVNQTRARLLEQKTGEIEKYKSIILDIVYSEPGFFNPAPKPGEKYQQANYKIGEIWCDVWYETLRKACDIIGSDELLLEALNALATTGHIKIIAIWIPKQRPMSAGEGFLLKFESGRATRDIPGQDTTFKMTRIYRSEPLAGIEKIPNAIINPKVKIENIRKSRAESARIQFGTSDLTKRSELRHEEIVDESQQRLIQQEILESLSVRGEKKMGENYNPSEFDTITQKIKTREVVETKVSNNTRVTQVYYQHTGEKLILEPGESGILTKMRLLEKMKVEKK